jgi:hypothetical protein
VQSESMILHSVFGRRASAEVRDQLVIASHHPDRLRRPSARPGGVEDERFHQSLTWNVFRTLELLTPAFWLRRFHSRVIGEPPTSSPQIVRIRLWQPIAPPPAQRIDGGRADVLVDVIIETEHTLWTLIVAKGAGRSCDPADRMADVIDAGAWLAGPRDHFAGVIESDTNRTSAGGIVTRRYSRSRDSAGLRSTSRSLAAPRPMGVGAVQWRDLAALLRECVDATHLSDIERALARNALRWLEDVGLRG